MNAQSHSVSWGSNVIDFALQRSERKRVVIEVAPDLSVVVRAPTGAAIEPVLAAVRKKARWILRQRKYFEQFLPRTPERVFKSGETHLYLGRRYQLKVYVVAEGVGVHLSGGRLHLSCRRRAPTQARRALLYRWYEQHAWVVFRNCIEQLLKHRLFRNVAAPKLRLRHLRKRWGSYSPKGVLSLNPELVRAPRRAVEYVIAHELCHAIVPNHSSDFFSLLGRVLPDWQTRKHLLEVVLA